MDELPNGIPIQRCSFSDGQWVTKEYRAFPDDQAIALVEAASQLMRCRDYALNHCEPNSLIRIALLSWVEQHAAALDDAYCEVSR